MLQYRGVARHESRSEKAEYLPERKIPRHDGEQYAERPECDIAFARATGHALVRQMFLAVIGIIRAARRRFLDFRFSLDDELAHLAPSHHATRQAALCIRLLAGLELLRLGADSRDLVAVGEPLGEHGVRA